MAAIEKRSREDWQELDKNHHLHPPFQQDMQGLLIPVVEELYQAVTSPFIFLQLFFPGKHVTGKHRGEGECYHQGSQQ